MLATAAVGDQAIVERTLPFSITSVARLLANVDAVRYCVARDVPGAFAECGVWRGGSVMAMIYALQELGRDDRDIYLYDTFDGMTAPGPADNSPVDPHALQTWGEAERTGRRAWPQFFGSEVFDEASTRERVVATGYPPHRLHFIRGRVEETLPEQAPAELALLRLDTDWYESTRHELVHLYPRLVDGGVLIVDDYGHWAGARRATDEFFSEVAAPILLTRLDYTARIGVKR
jgi:hypothetical protein